MIKNKNIEILLKKYDENKFSHIFLIETDDKSSAVLDVLSVVKYINCPESYCENCSNCNLCHLIDTNTLPTLSIIYPEGQAIKKNQMEELKLLFSCKPFLSRYNVYIIQDAEKFNASSANTILKFIEEPENNTIGFLITNNKENVINTIKSRCEIVKAIYNTHIAEHWDSSLVDLATQYIYDVEITKTKSIVANKQIMDQKLEKNQITELFHIIHQLYLQLLQGNVENEKLKLLEEFSLSKVIQRIQLINDILDKLNYNVNINLLLDYFVLSLED